MINLTIDNLGMNFEGVAREDGKVYFVPNALIGEQVDVEVVEDKSKYAKAVLKNIKTSSSDRVVPVCPYFYECGGCNLQHLNYEKQLYYKSKHVKETILKVAGVDCDVDLTVGCKDAYFYRNKGAFPITNNDIGMFKENSHELIPISQCFLMNDNITKALKVIRNYVKENNFEGFNFNNFTGKIKFAVIRSVKNQTLVCLVATTELPNLEDLYINLLNELGEVGLYLNINTQKNSTILGNNYKHINGLKFISLNEYGINYNIDIASFLQVNNDVKTKLYDKVLSEIENEIVIDAYAGAGLLSATISKKAKQVYSVEIIPQASKSANKLVKQNNINNMSVINGDCGKVLPKLQKEINNEFSLVLDPAHIGCDKDVINVAKNANKIIYISCNPIALSKDLKELTTTHDIKYIQPYDMFPQTKHVETLVCLIKKSR